jgi:hypothetical protein
VRRKGFVDGEDEFPWLSFQSMVCNDQNQHIDMLTPPENIGSIAFKIAFLIGTYWSGHAVGQTCLITYHQVLVHSPYCKKCYFVIRLVACALMMKGICFEFNFLNIVTPTFHSNIVDF